MIFLKEATRLFNSKELSIFAGGDLEFLIKVASRYKDVLDDNFYARDVFYHCYREAEKNYKNEYFFKNIITKNILIGRYSLNTSTMLSEFRVGSSKADCVILNGISTCYEIKSEYDSLVRLPEQLESYLKLFDKVYVVTTESHCDKLESILPDSVGVLKLNSRNALSEVKKASLSGYPVDVDVLMSSLRKNEYLEVVRNLFEVVPETSNAMAYAACRELLFTADSGDIRKAFCETLKKTRRIDKEFVGNLPESLLAAGVEYGLSHASKLKLLQNLNISLSKDTICTTQFFGENDMN